MQFLGLQTTLIRHLAAIEKAQKAIEGKVDTILTHLQKTTDDQFDPSNYDYSTLPTFPLVSEDSLVEFETQLGLPKEKSIFVRIIKFDL